MSRTVSNLIRQTQDILDRFGPVQESWHYASGYGGFFKDKEAYEALMTEVISLVHHIYGDGHPHYQRVIHFHNQHSLEGVKSTKGLLQGTLEVLKNGWIDRLADRVAVDISTDFLEAAREMASAGEKDAAAVLACSVLEDSLKRLAARTCSETLQKKELSVLANSLRKEGVIPKSTYSSIIGFKDLRNAAFHAKWDEVSKESVDLLLTFLPTFIDSYGVE